MAAFQPADGRPVGRTRLLFGQRANPRKNGFVAGEMKTMAVNKTVTGNRQTQLPASKLLKETKVDRFKLIPDLQIKAKRKPGHEQIAARAYERWVESGCVDGLDVEHWLAAEQELLALLNQSEPG